MKHYARLFIALMLCQFLSACNTVQGVGEDFKAAGQAIKETAEDTKRKIQR